MALYQESVIKKYLANIDKTQISQAYQKFRTHYSSERIEKIKQLKEEQYQEGYLREIFRDVLGYTINPDPDYNLTTEYKNEKDSKKADGAILKNNEAIGVIELKSTTTKDLSTIENQAFNYRRNQPKCRYVITSNFEKLRFYIDYAVDYEEFNLFEITEQQFQYFYFLLNKDSILSGLPLKMKEETAFHEENISKTLYKDYSDFKKKIFNNLVKNNPQYAQLTLYKKSQKLLDRFLFLFFGEDCGLLAPNMTTIIIDHYKKLKELDEYKPLYSMFNKFFNYINIGFKSNLYEIYAYNGGLFLKDEILDNVKIDDEVLLDETLHFSQYNFATEVDVNILGHIFENSLNEIEEFTARLEGGKLDKQKTKRKKEGIFYTPKYITKYIVENTIGALCNEKKKELGLLALEINASLYNKTTGKLNREGKNLYERLDQYTDYLLSLKILDPACGSGAFLNQALEFLIKEHQTIDSIRNELTGDVLRLFDTDKTILENNLYGVDINEEAVDIAKLSLWLRTAKKGRKLSILTDNIKCGNSLIDAPEVAGEKAFDWNKEFPEIMKNGGFDVVIGNPPYGAELSGKDWLKNKFKETSFGNIDSYKYFIQKGVELVRNKGVLSYIMPDSYLEKEYFKDLRKYVVDNFNNIRNIKLGDDIFDDVNLPTAIILLSNKGNQASNFEFIDVSYFKKHQKQNVFNNEDKFINDIPDYNTTFIIVKSIINTDQTVKLIDVFEQVMGVKVYQKGKGKPKQTVYEKENDVFISTFQTDKFSYPYISQGIERYNYENKNEFISYGEWLAEPREKIIFDSQKVIIREIVNPRIYATFIEEPAIVKNIAAVIINRKNDFSLKYLLAVINSKLLTYYVDEQSPKSSNKSYPSFNSKLIKNIPIKDISKEAQQPFIEKAIQMLDINKQLQEKKNKFISRIKSNLEVEKISKKLETFYDYDFKTFAAELKKQKVTLSLVQQDEWEEYFKTYKTEINNLQKQITQTDNQIDLMVYNLYGLSEEEIGIVERR